MKRHTISYIEYGQEKHKSIPVVLNLDDWCEGGKLENLEHKIDALIRYCELLTDILLSHNIIDTDDIAKLSSHQFLTEVAITGLTADEIS